VYNASEGYFGVQDVIGRDDMLLMTNNGVYYEFIPVDELDNTEPVSHSLKEVEIGINYAIVISSCSGLWRYIVGDTICFTAIQNSHHWSHKTISQYIWRRINGVQYRYSDCSIS